MCLILAPAFALQPSSDTERVSAVEGSPHSYVVGRTSSQSTVRKVDGARNSIRGLVSVGEVLEALI